MKHLFFSIVTLMLFSIQSYASNPIEIDLKKSKVEWVGKKITGQHTGDVKIQSGSLLFDEGRFSGGEFIIDMTTINTTDLQGGTAEKLNGHLKSPDFFGVESHPTSSIEITKVSDVGTIGDYKVVANLTIKKITKEIKFYVHIDESSRTASAEIIVDRTDFNVRYGSGSFFDNLGDNTIYDEFNLKVLLSY